MPRPIYPRRRRRTHCIGGWVGPKPGLAGCGKSRPHRQSTHGPSSPWPVVVPTELYRCNQNLKTTSRYLTTRWWVARQRGTAVSVYLPQLFYNLTFMGPCILSILQYISNKMRRYTVYLYLETAVHVSGGTSTHHQKYIQLYLQHLIFVSGRQPQTHVKTRDCN
jgi:hypothetical protein